MPVNNTTLTIPAGQSLSSAGVNISAALGVIIQTPAVWSGGNLSFQISVDGTNWVDLYGTDGREVTVPIVLNAAIAFPNIDLAKNNVQLKIRSGSSGFPRVQAADRSIIVSVAT